MTRLYIGNPTRQILQFMYRVPEVEGFPLRTMRIEIGQQVMLPDDFSTPQVQAVIKQHEKYGITATEDVERTKSYIPIIYSVDRPIAAQRLARALAHNSSILVQRGKMFRQEAAVAEAVRIENVMRDNAIPAALQAFESSVMEDAPSGVGEFSEGTRVSRLINPDGSPLATANKGRRKAA